MSVEIRKSQKLEDIFLIPDLKNPYTGMEKETSLANVRESDDCFTIALTVPGLSLKDFEIKVGDDILIIRFAYHGNSKKRTKGYPCVKFFRLDDNIDKNRIVKDYCDGVLKLVLPKKTYDRAL